MDLPSYEIMEKKRPTELADHCKNLLPVLRSLQSEEVVPHLNHLLDIQELLIIHHDRLEGVEHLELVNSQIHRLQNLLTTSTIEIGQRNVHLGRCLVILGVSSLAISTALVLYLLMAKIY